MDYWTIWNDVLLKASLYAMYHTLILS